MMATGIVDPRGRPGMRATSPQNIIDMVALYRWQMMKFGEQQSCKMALTHGCGKLDRAVEMGSASTVCWILDHEDFSTEELDRVLISALVWKFPECLDALLKSVARRRKAFNSINPYHVFLTFSRYDFSSYTSPLLKLLETCFNNLP